jgi:hypothetical protein
MEITKKELKRLTLDLGADCVHIYVDNKDKAEPIHIAYWLMDEWEEDAEVAVCIFRAINYFHIDKKLLLNLLGYCLVD